MILVHLLPQYRSIINLKNDVSPFVQSLCIGKNGGLRVLWFCRDIIQYFCEKVKGNFKGVERMVQRAWGKVRGAWGELDCEEMCGFER